MPARRDLVINTGPLLALAAAGHLDVLREQFAKVIVPHEVWQSTKQLAAASDDCTDSR